MMAILQNDKRIEQLETSAGLTESNEFSFASNPNTYVPSGLVYHKIVTKSKEVIYQTKNKPEKSSQKIIREKNLTPLEIYRQAKNNNIKTSKYFKNKKVEPKEADYKKGYFDRYFLQLASDDKAPIIEVKKKDYTKADSTYLKTDIRWSLNKDIKEQERLNLNNILSVEKTFPQIRMKIYNFVEFGKES
tara:strand:- start:36 stop:602 length:567 start_codon:yes stop_codon:yes gene_type:complete